MDRRQFLASAPVVAATACSPAIAASDLGQDDTAIITEAHDALLGVLSRTAPDGLNVHHTFILVAGKLMADAFPPNYQRHDPYASFDSESMTWQMNGS